MQRGDKEYAEAVNREATTHRGPHADAIERKGVETERGNVYRDVLDTSKTLEALRAERADVERQIAEAERETRRGAEHQTAQTDRQPPENVRGVARDIWEARQRSDSPQAFIAALQEHGIVLASATGADVQKQATEIEAKREFWIKPFKEGEIVAVTKRGDVYRLTERTTGVPAQDSQKFTEGLKLESVGRARETMLHARDAERLAAATARGKDAPQQRGKEPGQVVAAQAERLAGKAVEAVVKIAEAAIEMFDATPMTPERIAAAIDAKEERQAQAEIHGERSRREADYERHVEDALRQAREKEDLERAYRDQQERERER